MATPTVTVIAPPPDRHPDPGILRPRSLAKWADAVGPTVDVLHEWDTVNTFDSPNLIQDSNTGVAVGDSPNEGTPPSDLGPAGTAWYYRATVTDNDDSASTTSPVTELAWYDPEDSNRYLHLLAVAGVGFAAGLGDGDPEDSNRYLYLLAVAGVGFDPTDTPAAGWGPAESADPGDGFTDAFNRYLYLLGDVNTDVPTPHIWYVYPAFGREGWEFKIIGYGFGDTQATYNGTVLLNALGASVIDWQLIAETSTDLTIDADDDIAEPIHQQVRAVVPVDAESGLVFICTDA